MLSKTFRFQRLLLVAPLALCLLFISQATQAHDEARAKLTLHSAQSLSIGLPATKVNESLTLDNNGDQQLQWSEVLQASAEIAALYKQQVDIQSDAGICTKSWQPPLQITPYKGEHRLVATFNVDCPNSSSPIGISTGFNNIDYSIVETYNGSTPRLLNNHSQLSLAEVSLFATAIEFLYQGVVHIVIGYDHILFLLGLMLTVTATTRASQGLPLKRYLVLITSFTAAHSITLVAASLNWASIPITWAEFIIAGSVLFAALAHYNRFFTQHLAWFCFAFGLIHGFGFASVLGDLISQQEQRILPLVSFNIGVELGQIAIAGLAMLPLALLARSAKRRWFYHSASLLLAITACIWLADRWPVG